MAKKTTKTPEKEKTVEKKIVPKAKYLWGLGRRKTATARVKLFPEGSGKFSVNNRESKIYFPTESLQRDLMAPLSALGLEKKVDIVANVSGGGVAGQAKAISLGISRALIVHEPAQKTVLKKQGLMTRDSRKKERKKPGLKRARRAPQWQKR